MTDRSIEVDLHDFDDQDILNAADEIVSQRGMLTGRASGPYEDLRGRVGDLAHAIAQQRTDEALLLLVALIGDDRPLAEAVDIGRRRAR